MNIKHSASSVDAKQSGDTTNAQTSARRRALFTTSDRSFFLDADGVKEDLSFIKLLRYDGHKVQRSGNYIKCRCPFHDDDTPSFVIYKDNDAHCFGCRWHGDIIKYTREAHALDFIGALKRLDALRGQLVRDSSINDDLEILVKASLTTGKKTPQDAIAKYTQRLETDLWIRERICTQRLGEGHKWNPDTLMRLAKEGTLGWSGDALAFIYPRGVKFRNWPIKEFLWESEGPSIWRQHRIKAATTVYLCESETDAIAAIDAGVEVDETVAVVAISGVNSFLDDWALLFRGKVVVLSFDNDSAGNNRAYELTPILLRYASDVKIPNYKEDE